MHSSPPTMAMGHILVNINGLPMDSLILSDIKCQDLMCNNGVVFPAVATVTEPQ